MAHNLLVERVRLRPLDGYDHGLLHLIRDHAANFGATTVQVLRQLLATFCSRSLVTFSGPRTSGWFGSCSSGSLLTGATCAWSSTCTCLFGLLVLVTTDNGANRVRHRAGDRSHRIAHCAGDGLDWVLIFFLLPGHLVTA